MFRLLMTIKTRLKFLHRILISANQNFPNATDFFTHKKIRLFSFSLSNIEKINRKTCEMGAPRKPHGLLCFEPAKMWFYLCRKSFYESNHNLAWHKIIQVGCWDEVEFVSFLVMVFICPWKWCVFKHKKHIDLLKSIFDVCYLNGKHTKFYTHNGPYQISGSILMEGQFSISTFSND